MPIYTKSLLAGMLIGLAGLTSLLAPDRIIGACFFSIGLISVILLQANLYTGKIGFVSKDNWKQLPIMLLGNAAGAWLTGKLTMILCGDKAALAQSAKYLISYPECFIRSFLCGICVYLAIALYKCKQDIILIALPVIIFVVSGFNHCIAEIFYMSASGIYDLPRLLIYIIGNSLGAIAINFLASD